MLNSRFFPLALLTLLACSACSPPWTVVRQSGPPSALAGAQSVGVFFDYTQLMVDGQPEQAFVANSDDVDAVAKFQSVKDAFESGVVQTALSAMPVPTGKQTQGSDVSVTVRVESLVRGKYAVIYAKNTEVVATLVWQRAGVVTDEIRVQASVTASITRPAIVQRTQMAGDQVGNLMARFFDAAQE